MKNYRIRGRAASHSSRLRTGKAAVALTAVFVAAALLLPAAIVATAAAASLAPPLTRYPYLTDVVGGNATVNFGTDQSKISAVVKWGQAGAESCTAHSTTATKTNISVNGVGEYQWKAQLSPLQPDTAYCYRVYFGTAQIDLLGSDPAPQFVTQLPVGSAKPFSFAVLGDSWGGRRTPAGTPTRPTSWRGSRPAAPASRSPPVIPVTRRESREGATAILEQTGLDISAVFGPQYWTVVGKSIPMFHSIGDRAPTSTFLTNWPSAVAAAASGGTVPDGFLLLRRRDRHEDLRDRLVRLRPGQRPLLHPRTRSRTAPMSARGASTRSTTTCTGPPGAQRDEYTWLANDLAAHPGQLKFAVFHYPLHSDQSSQNSDPYIWNGPGT